MASPLQGQQRAGCRKTGGKGAKWTQILAMSYSTPRMALWLWRESINGASSLTLCGANHECAAGGLDHVLCDDIQLVNKQDPLNLHKQPVEQPEIAIGDAADSGNGLRVRKISAVEGQAQLAPMARQHKGELVLLQWTVVMREDV